MHSTADEREKKKTHSIIVGFVSFSLAPRVRVCVCIYIIRFSNCGASRFRGISSSCSASSYFIDSRRPNNSRGERERESVRRAGDLWLTYTIPARLRWRRRRQRGRSSYKRRKSFVRFPLNERRLQAVPTRAHVRPHCRYIYAGSLIASRG